MVEDIKERVGYDEYPEVLEEIAEHGADQGWSGFTYTVDCIEFYEAHKDVIWELLREDCDQIGYRNIMQMIGDFDRAEMLDTEEDLKNILAWYALESVCRNEQ